MKVVIGPYREWIGPYQIADLLCWWVPKKLHPGDAVKRKPDWVHDFGTWLSHDSSGNDSWLLKTCQWIESKRHRQVYVRVDKYDSWGADHTLALIAVPLLKQLRATTHGGPNVDDVDVPEGQGLRSYECDTLPMDEFTPDANHFKRWDWVLGEIVWALEQKTSDSVEDQFYTKTNPDLKSKNIDEIMENMVIDWDAMQKWQARKTNGYRLFGKYYENLWD